MKNKDLKQLRKQLEQQNARIVPKTKGWMIYPPDRNAEPVMLHFTESDWRANKNIKALLRNRGFNV